MLREYIKMAVEGNTTSLIVVSRAGLGKTSAVLDALNQAGLVRGQHYLYLSNFITPVEMFNILQQTQETLEAPKLLVMDDVEMMLKDKKIVGMLRGALWGADGKRVVNYISGTHKIHAQTIDDWQGKIIFLLNEYQAENPIMNALKDRGLYYRFDLNNNEVLEIMRTRMLPQEYKGLALEDRQKVFNFLKKANHSQRNNLTLRHLIRGYDCYLFSKDNWQRLLIGML